MIEQHTCPHCGAEAVRLMRNGEKYSKGYACGWRIGVEKNASIERSAKCYERQLAAQAEEIERLKQAVLDEREACEAVAKAHVCDCRCKLTRGVDKFCKVAIAQEIRARGEVK
jgi:hypothetical protein